MDNPIIIDAKDVLKLRKFKKLWIIGWVISTVLLLTVGVQTTRIIEHRRQVAQIQALAKQVDDLVEKQRVVNEAFTKAFEAQNRTADLLISWGTYVKEKADIVTTNTRAVSRK